MTAPSLAEVAGKLTQAQRRMLLQGESWSVLYVDMRTLPSLNRLGLISRGEGIAMRLHEGRVYLNHAGLALRAHLIAQEDQHD